MGQRPASHAFSAEHLVANARELIPVLRDAVAETDRNRRLSDVIVADMRAKGMFSLMAPARYGGSQVSLQTYTQVIGLLAEGDGSAGWVACLVNVANYITAMLYPEQVHEQVFATPGGAMVAGVLAPRSIKASRVDGGMLIEQGLWTFNSGVFHADWDLLAIPIMNEAGETIEQGLAALPIDDVKLLDEWYTIGMRGTGSTTVSVDNVFVPDVRISSMSGALTGNYGSPHLRGEALYRTAFVPIAAIVLAYPALGMARAALDVFLDKLPGRAIPYTIYDKQIDAPVTHVAVAEASVKIDAATLLVTRANEDIERWAAEHEELMDLKLRARIRLDTGFAIRLCYEAVDTLANAAGGSFAMENSPLNRIWRDLRTVSLHAIACPTTNLELYGRIMCGLEPNTLLV